MQPLEKPIVQISVGENDCCRISFLFVQISVGGAAPEQRRCSRRSSAVVQISVGEDDFWRIRKDSGRFFVQISVGGAAPEQRRCSRRSRNGGGPSSRFHCGKENSIIFCRILLKIPPEAHRPDFSRCITARSSPGAAPVQSPEQSRCSLRSSSGADAAPPGVAKFCLFYHH